MRSTHEPPLRNGDWWMWPESTTSGWYSWIQRSSSASPMWRCPTQLTADSAGGAW